MEPAAHADPLTSVVIPMYNAEKFIGEQLAALANQDFRGSWEVIVADNGSTDDSAAQVARFAVRVPRLRVVDASDRQGASHARNVGSQAAKGTRILYADADDIVSQGWVRCLSDALEQHAFVAGWSRPGIGTQMPRGAMPPRDLPRSFDFLPWALGGNCGIRRTVVDEIGGWSEEYPHGGDDIDFCWRVQLAGYPLQYVPEAIVSYRQRESLRELASQQFEFGARAPLLMREFQHHGATRRPTRVVIANYLWLLSRIPYLATNQRRRIWVSNAAGALGRVVGSFRWRTLCL